MILSEYLSDVVQGCRQAVGLSHGSLGGPSADWDGHSVLCHILCHRTSCLGVGHGAGHCWTTQDGTEWALPSKS